MIPEKEKKKEEEEEMRPGSRYEKVRSAKTLENEKHTCVCVCLICMVTYMKRLMYVTNKVCKED